MRESEEPLIFGIDYPARLDRRSHIDHINQNLGGQSPAWLPRAARWHAPGTQLELEPERDEIMGERKRYMLLERAFVNDSIVDQGSVVWLTDEEVGPHHMLMEEPMGIEALSPDAQAELKQAFADEAKEEPELKSIETLSPEGQAAIKDAADEKSGEDAASKPASEDEAAPATEKHGRSDPDV